MNYENFFENLEENIFSSETVRSTGAEVSFHLKGETAAPGDDETERFIRNTNMKYFNVENSTLLDDFAEVKFPCLTDCDKTNFVRFEVKFLYEIFCRDGWEGVLKHVCDNISYAEHIEKSAGEVICAMECYEKIRDRLIIRPLNYKNNRVQLTDYVFRKKGDIALVLYAIVLDDEKNNCLNTIRIPKKIFEKWNRSWDDVLEETLRNTSVISMPRLYTSILSAETTPDSESAFMAADFPEKSLRPETIPLVTTTRKTNGAIALFYPGVKERIAEMFGDSFYVAFTSIHEAMIHKKGTVDPSGIRRHLRATNNSFGPEDTLSDNVFYYDKSEGTFSMVTEQ